MKLAADGPTALRADAIRLLGMFPDKAPPVSFFLDLTANPSAEIRKAAVGALQSQTQRLTREDVTRLLGSEHADVRRTALDLSFSLPQLQAVDLIADCVLDDNLEVRTTAIRYAGLRGIAGWQQILRQSLKDPNLQIQTATVETLLARRDPECRQMLVDFLATCQNAALAESIRQQLGRIPVPPLYGPRQVLPRPAPTRPPLPRPQ